MRTLRKDVGLLITHGGDGGLLGRPLLHLLYVAGQRVWSQCFEWEPAGSRNWVTVMSARTRTSWR
jgi:hypothetical protein